MSLEIAPFSSSLNYTLEELAGVTATTGAPKLMKGDELLSDISVTICLEDCEDDTFFLLTGDKNTAQKLAKMITGDEKIEQESPLVKDALAEILNILVGVAQRKSKFSFNFSLPMFIDGSNSKVTSIFRAKFKSTISLFQGGELSLYMLSNVMA